jgi:EAL domain-containing protein (putative c-di-GMP-specific phosphodiesterase class I)/FixJ family two-component response regulator
VNQRTVYLIDDEKEMLDMLSDVIKITGLTVQSYSHAGHFFEQVKTFEHDSILVLDLNMPDIDGIEVIRRLSTMSAPPALILMSGHDSGVLHAAEKLGRAQGLEIIAYIGKPIDLKKFKKLLTSTVLEATKLAAIESTDSEPNFEDLHWAINHEQLILHYQPQFNLSTKSIIGVEALVRWQHPKLGLIYPERFILLAEQQGLIGDLTHWVVEKAIKQRQLWHEIGLDILVSVNISSVDITSSTLPGHLTKLLENNKLDPMMLMLEVTESALMGELVSSLEVLTRLRLKGVGLSIDDFGTGYSSLSQLHRVPFTELKIDRSFVANISDDEEAKAIVKTCIILGHELNLQVVAEGVETQEQAEILTSLGCDVAQGHFYSKPLIADEITQTYKPSA